MRRHKACAKLSLASPFGGGALQRRAERARCQRPLRMGCVEALAGCPLSRLTATAPPKGEPSMCATKSLRKAKSRLPLWGALVPSGHQHLVSAAASVGDGRSPLGCITRAGRRECPRRGRRGQPASGTSPKQFLFALTYRPAVPYNHTTSWGSSLLGLPSGNVNTLANAWYCLKKRDSWKTSIWHGVFSASLFSCAGHPEFWR